MEWKEFTAKTVEEALTDAAVFLQVPSSMVDYEVLEEGKSGFIGFFSKPAKIRAKIKSEDPVMKESVTTVKTAQAAESDANSQYEQTNVTITESSKKDEQVKDRSIQTLASKDTKSEKPEKKCFHEDVDVEGIVTKFLGDVFEAMNIQATVKVRIDCEDSIVYVNVEGSDMGILIGKRGQTLDSLQYLTSLVINKETSSYLKVKMDTENYRARRKETLENLARNIAYKVKRTKRPVSLEPMNPYERRIIHATLQNDRYVETHSEGEEPFRRVVITLKKGYRDYNNRNNNGHGRSFSNRREYKNPSSSQVSGTVTGE